MSQESPRHPFLSDAELRALLDESPQSSPIQPAPSTTSPGFVRTSVESHGRPVTAADSDENVLILSRHDAAVELLCDRCSTLGIGTEVVRNPFTALDRLRQSPVSILFSDTDLWTNGAALLFQRLPSFPSVPHVVFLGDSAALEGNASNACPFLRLPLEPRDVELTLQHLGKVTEPEPDKSDAQAVARSKYDGDGDGDGDGAVPIDAPLEAVDAAVDLVWLRFFRCAYRAWREADSLAALRSRWLSASMDGDGLGARAVEWVMLEGGEWRGEVRRRTSMEPVDFRDASRLDGGLNLTVTLRRDSMDAQGGSESMVSWSVVGVPSGVVLRVDEFRDDLEALLRAGVAKFLV